MKKKDTKKQAKKFKLKSTSSIKNLRGIAKRMDTKITREKDRI